MENSSNNRFGKFQSCISRLIKSLRQDQLVLKFIHIYQRQRDHRENSNCRWHGSNFNKFLGIFCKNSKFVVEKLKVYSDRDYEFVTNFLFLILQE